MCKNCGCGGQPDIDYKDLGNLTGGADECFEIAKGNSFCGNMILMDFGNGRCYCRGIGKESSCNKKQLPGRNASVYQSGMQANAIKNNKKFATVSIIPFKNDCYNLLYIFTLSRWKGNNNCRDQYNCQRNNERLRKQQKY